MDLPARQENGHKARPHSAPLRVGVMLNSHVVPNWMHRTLSQIQASDYARIELVVFNGSESAEMPVVGWKARIGDIYKRGIFNRYVTWDQNHYRLPDDQDAFHPADASELLTSAEFLTVSPIRRKFTDRFKAEDVAAIREYQLDVMIRFGFRIIRGEILDVANYGVWSYHHGDNREYRGGPALFWEMYESNPVSGIVLQILSDQLDGGRVIYRSVASTEMNSLYMNRNPIFWKGAELVPRRLDELHRFGWDYITSLDTYNESISYEKAIYRTPTSPRMIWFLGRRVLRGVRYQIEKRLFRDHWFCAVGSRDEKGTTKRWIEPESRDPSRFFADPFLLEHEGRTWLLAEELPYATNKGLVSVAEVTSEGTITPFRVVMDEDVHLSYPCVFKHQGEIFMTPETAEAGEIRLYRATQFPDKWALDSVLLKQIQATDPTIFWDGETFYLFTNVPVPNSSYDDELHLFYADELRGPWYPHPLNPIKSDVQSSRPAGHLYFDESGQLIRPAQDCSVRYGYAIRLNRVTTLSRTEYAEEEFEQISPTWCRGKATHTINRTGRFEVRDGQVRRWAWT